MQIKDVFANDVTRDIAPVIYFHEQDPAKVAAEVSEYIVTGGYPEGDPRSKIGIHEQFVKLLGGLAEELQKASGVELPASWISGFYGSGKSSFAKLLGLALDGLTLPDGQEIAEVLLKRDESAKSSEFKAAWTKVRSLVQPIAVIFDIGAVARDDEQIHSAVKREIQKRLGYCSTSNYVADYELNLELAGLWSEFEASAQQLLGRAWAEAKGSRMAEEEFSQVMHAMNPSLYTDPLSWFESRAGANTGEGSSVDETIKAIAAVSRAGAIQQYQVAQLEQVAAATEVQAEIAAVAAQLLIDRPWRDIAGLEPQLRAIESHYKIVRRSLLERQEQQAEAIRHKVKQRSGYARLSPDQATYILSPVQEATYDTTAEALYPPLLVLKDSAVLGLQMAEEKANSYLDDALSQATDEQVMTIAIDLSGREVSSPEEVEALVNQLRDRLLFQLNGKSNIRIRLI